MIGDWELNVEFGWEDGDGKCRIGVYVWVRRTGCEDEISDTDYDYHHHRSTG